ncbi:hypothetical protein [Jiulongibacter sediminis]|uniref:Uncharacterized protein n=1 Tax=Jiulongibacter sediminis TaxID=1605367 RepID=A0A0P7C2T4_9BACT|nr:hypothetical protein [Jiulongibacter sediminis]KPM48441.1 hypothetical protein AFM12_07340 [Jiulongibacter sediminis]TBX24979.1 hypothetical protein TK44_07345 [Jiulongibacter sediminis]
MKSDKKKALEAQVKAIQRRSKMLKQAENELSELEKRFETYFKQTGAKLNQAIQNQGNQGA